ncbi:M1 family metallopeptidase [Aureitalea sp. L0-47]|uniref:M1 family metallopeptidase n=1 Tax=Aureitalea sp. L0-47 TaxID=2816962 RepID=UPI002238271D|nr:M1 family metallopeptidase [Aureitalea sp. L0-47]MCW5519581.1 M1 family metallopeptidase [Aureitalea sp. L0-47]
MKHLLLLLAAFTFFGSHAQQTDVVDFLEIRANLYASPENKTIEGGIEVTFKMLKDADSVYLDAVNMERLSLDGDYDNMNVEANEDKFWIIGNFKEEKEYKIFFSYRAEPKQTLYFTGDQIWTQGQGKYTSHWLPSIDDMNDKIEFDLSILVESEKRVVTNGALNSLTTRDSESLIVWNFNMDEPMSSYLVALVIGNFSKNTIQSESGVPIELYFRPEDSLKAEPTYRYTKEIFDFLEEEIGVPYPWQNYKQVPVRDFLYAGMENTTATIFSEAFVVDSIGFNDRNYVNVNAHELAHHWFGNLVTETSGTHHWLQEGFATYYAHLAEKEIFGDDYFYWVMYQSAEQLKELSDQGKGESLLNPKASSLTFYEKGAWALHILREKIGDEAFKSAIRSYLQKHKFKNVNTEDFLSEVRAATDADISNWEQDWLQQTAFKAMQAYSSLSESEFMDSYFQVSSLRAGQLSEKIDLLEKAIEEGNDFIGQEAVYQLSGENPLVSQFLYEKALDSDNLFIRQAVAISMDGVTERLKPKFERLLDDPSYVTIEAALYSLWNSFPNDRARYLDQTESIAGFQDKNVRQLWLALAIITPDYRLENKSTFVNELRDYSSAKYSFEIRQKAFEYLAELQMYNDEVIDNLVDASVHHNWRFRSGARNMLKQLSEDPEVKKSLYERLDQFSEKEKQYLTTKIISE